MADEGERDRAGRWVALGAAALFALLAGHAARVETPTVDEFAHVPAGASYLVHGDLSLYAKNPPLVQALVALPVARASGVVVPEPTDLTQGWGPWIHGSAFMRANAARYFDLFFRARLVAIALTLLTGALLFRWGRSLFGERAAGIATALFLLNPLVLAHGHLATVDAGCALAVLAAAVALRRASVEPSTARFAVAGAVFGVALLAKFTTLLLAPAILFVLALARRTNPRRALLDAAALGLAALLVVNIGMGFDGSFRPLRDYRLVSGFGQSLQAVLPGALPVPLPESWLVGFDAAKRDSERGEFGSYLLGEWSTEGWWYHDLVGLFAKTPLPVVLLWLASPLALARRRLDRIELAALLAPPAALLVAMLAFNRVHIGVRYLLPVLPFLYLCAASLFAADRAGRRVLGWTAAAGLLAWHLATLAWIHPNHLGHFSVAVGGSGHGHWVLADSNLDWGQDLYRVKPALDALGETGPVHLLYFGHVDPALYGLDARIAPPHPVQGVVAVSLNYLLGSTYPVTAPNGRFVRIQPGHAAWLRDREPALRAGSIWIFDTRAAPR